METGKIQRDSDDARGRALRGTTRRVDVAARTIEFTASTVEVDREGEIVRAQGLTNRDAYLGSNAPLLAAHTHWLETGEPTQIGWVQELTVEAARITGRARFAETAVAEQWWALARDPAGKGVAISIGFIPIQMVRAAPDVLAAEYPELADALGQAEIGADRQIRVYTVWELLEISAVPVPANRESLQALARAVGAGGATPPDAPGDAVAALKAAIAEAVDGRAKAIEAAIAQMQKTIDELPAVVSRDVAQIAELIESLLPETLEDTDAGAAPMPRAPAGSDSGGAEAKGQDELMAAARRLREAVGKRT